MALLLRPSGLLSHWSVSVGPAPSKGTVSGDLLVPIQPVVSGMCGQVEIPPQGRPIPGLEGELGGGAPRDMLGTVSCRLRKPHQEHHWLAAWTSHPHLCDLMTMDICMGRSLQDLGASGRPEGLRAQLGHRHLALPQWWQLDRVWELALEGLSAWVLSLSRTWTSEDEGLCLGTSPFFVRSRE